jgi:hypothetical protein
MVAALARCAQLRSQIDELSETKAGSPREPRTTAEAIAEQHRLEAILAELQGKEAAHDQEDLAAVVARARLEADDEEDSTNELVRSVAQASLAGALIFGAVFGVMYSRDGHESVGTGDVSKQLELASRFDAVVKSGTGVFEPEVGWRCEVEIADWTDATRACRVHVRCNDVEQGLLAATCPDGRPGALANEDERILSVESFDDVTAASRGRATLRLERPKRK